MTAVDLKIPFNVPAVIGNETAYMAEAVANRKLSGDGTFNKKAVALINSQLKAPSVSLAPSCTAALEMAYLLISLQPGDEVILPSFTFTSSATAITLFGATPVFVDVDRTLNLDLAQVEAAITTRTKAICPVHYAGASCDMDALSILVRRQRHKIYIIEDAAQAYGSLYRGRPLGTMGDIAAFSFHETKNVVCGEGGAIVINNAELIERAEIIRDKGTNRQRFVRGEVDKYTWQDKGSSYLLGELPAAYLCAQLERAPAITEKRIADFALYDQVLLPLESRGCLQRPIFKDFNRPNGHIFFVLLESEGVRVELAARLRQSGILAVSHYVPLHSAPAGIKFGRSFGGMGQTNANAGRLLRLPMYYDLSREQILTVCDEISKFY